MTVAPGEINLENKLDVIQHAPQKKTARSADSMNDVIAFYKLTLFVFSRLDWNEHTIEARAGNIV